MKLSPVQKIFITSALFWPTIFVVAVHLKGGNVFTLGTAGAVLGGLFGYYHSKLIWEAGKHA